MILYSVLISLSFASNILIKAPEANSGDFFVYSHQSKHQTISEHLLKCKNENQLNEDLKKAQFHFLNSDLEKARSHFQKIINQRWNCDWNSKQRKTINYAYYRLAQININKVEQMQLLTEAISFDENIPPNETLIPPPIVKMYQSIKKDLMPKTYSLPSEFKKFSHLLRNGKKISLNTGVLQLNPMKARYTFVSDSYLPESFILSPSQLENKTIDAEPLISGNCDNFQLSNEIQSADNQYEVYFSPDCQKNSTVTVASNTFRHTNPQTLSDKFAYEQTLPQTNKKSWLRRNYLWVGAAAILTSALIVHQMSQKDDSHSVVLPSSTYSPETN